MGMKLGRSHEIKAPKVEEERFNEGEGETR